MVTLHLIYLGTDESTLILDPVEAPSVLAALGLIDAEFCRPCGGGLPDRLCVLTPHP